jgi:hypothetical protein
MSQTEPDPSQSTAQFRAFVERGSADRANTSQRRVQTPVIVGIVAIVVVLAIAVWLVF